MQQKTAWAGHWPRVAWAAGEEADEEGPLNSAVAVAVAAADALADAAAGIRAAAVEAVEVGPVHPCAAELEELVTAQMLAHLLYEACLLTGTQHSAGSPTGWLSQGLCH